MNASTAKLVLLLTALLAAGPSARAQDGYGAPCGSNASCCGAACACDACECACGPKWHVSGEILYWRAEREALDFALSGQPAPPAEALRGQVENLRIDSNVGLRVGAAYGSQEGCLLGGYYTHFESDGERTVTGPANSIVPIRVPAVAGFDRGDLAAATANIQLEIIDLEVSRRFHPYDSLAVRGFAGLRYASLEQDFDIFYRTNAPAPGATGVVNMPSDFDGLGVRAGFDGHWKLCGCLSVFGLGAVSLLEGESQSAYVFDNLTNNLADSNIRDESWRTVPVVETAVGIAWRGCRWNLAVGYEVNHWFNVVNEYSQQGDINFTNTLDRTTSDVGFHGLFGRVAFDF